MSAQWDPGEFWRLYYSFWGKLADLKFVDQMVEWSENDRFTGGRVGNYRYETTVGNDHHFEITVTRNGGYRGWPDDCRAEIDVERQQAQAWADGIFDGVDATFAFISSPDTTALVPVIDSLDNAAADLRAAGEQGDLGDLGAYLSDWSGDSFENFMAFKGDVTASLDLQADFIGALSAYIDTAGGCTRTGQLALMDALVNLDAATDAQIANRVAEAMRDNSSTLKFFKLAAVGLSLTSLFPSPFAVATKVGAQLLSAAATAIPASVSQPVDIQVMHADEIAEQFTSAVSEAVSGVNALFDTLRSERTHKLDTRINRYWEHLVLERPDIADGVTPEAFHHSSSPYAD